MRFDLDCCDVVPLAVGRSNDTTSPFSQMTSRDERVQLLAAVPPEAVPILTRALNARAELLWASTLNQALGIAARGVNAIVCGIHFDESRMFELLRKVKAGPASAGTPFICVRLLGTNLAPALIQSLQISCSLLGAAKFIDLYGLERIYGSDRAEIELGRMIVTLAAAPPGTRQPVDGRAL